MRIFASLYTVAFLALVDTSFIAPVISAYAQSLGASDALAGFIAALYSLAAIPASLLTGLLLDRFNRRLVVQVLFLLDALAIYSYSISRDPYQLMIARTAHAVFDSGVFPGSLSMFRDLVSERFGNRLSWYWIFVGSSILIGSSTSRLVVGSLGFEALFALLSILMLFGFAATASLGPMYRGFAARRGPGMGGLRTGLRVSGRASVPIAAYLSAFTLYALIGSVIGGLSPVLITLYGFDERRAAVETATYQAVATLASLPMFTLVGRLVERGLRTVLATLLAGASASLIASSALALSLDPMARLAASIVTGAAIASTLLPSSLLAVEVGGGVRGLSSAFYSMALLLGVIFAAPLAGWGASAGLVGVDGLRLHASFLPSAATSLTALLVLLALLARLGPAASAAARA